MKKAICLIAMIMLLGTGILPSFAQYRKPVSEMSDEELDAFSRELRDKVERYTRRTRAALSAPIGQDVSLGLDGLALLKRYYPNLISAVVDRANQAASDPMLMSKSMKEEPSIGDRLFNSGMSALLGIIGFADEQLENHIERDLRNIYTQNQQDISDEDIEAEADEISDSTMMDQVEAMNAEGNHVSSLIITVYMVVEVLREGRRRTEARRPGPRSGPARGAPTGQPGPQGWILGRPGGNGESRGGEVVTVTGGGCARIVYDADNNPILIIEPCK